MRTYSYSRVSNDERSKDQRQKQEAQGELNKRIEAQQAEHRAYCASNQLPEPLTYSDICSGSDEKQKDRKGQLELLSRIQPGDMLIVSKVDRWSRDLVWAVGSIRDLVRRDITIRFTSDAPRDAKTDDSMIGIMAWAADQERKRIKERTVGARIRLRKEGYWAGATTPVGYDVGPDKRLVPGKDADVVRAMFALCIAGKSLHEISRTIRAQYPRTNTRWLPNQIRALLHSRIYLGEVRPTKGADWVIDCHEPLVSETDFARAAKALEARRTAKRGGGLDSWTANLIGRGLMTCSRCGHSVTTHRAKVELASGPALYDYYVCSRRNATRAAIEGYVRCSGTNAKVEVVDALLTAQLANRLTELRSVILDADAKVKADAPSGFDYAGELKRLEAKRSRLVETYTEGDLSKEDYKARLTKLDREIGDTKIAIENLSDGERASLPESRARLAAYLDGIGEALKTAEGSDVRALLSTLARGVTLRIDSGKAPRSRYHPNEVGVTIEWREPAELLRTAARDAA